MRISEIPTKVVASTNCSVMKALRPANSRRAAAKAFSNPIVTKVVPIKAFYPAENYHQNYATLHPDSPYIARFDLPKVANLQKEFPELYVAPVTN